MRKVFDASAVVAFLYNERGADRVRAGLPEGVISAVNAAEVLEILVRNGLPAEAAHQSLTRTGLRVVPFSLEDAVQMMVLLTPAARARGISLLDRACLALGMTTRLPVVTADRNWTGLDVVLPDGRTHPLSLEIEQIR